MLTGTNLTHAKAFNLRIVRETIRLFGPISRADIARRSGLTAQTVSNLTKELIDQNLVVEAERRQEGRGAPSTALAINPRGGFAIGLDFDRDHLTGVLMDLAGTVHQQIAYELDAPAPGEALDRLEATARDLLAAEGLAPEAVWGVGIGVPGPMHAGPNGSYVVSPKAFSGWHDVPVADQLRERLGLPVVLANNATAAAIGERWFGAAQHIPTFFYAYFGSGLGGGLFLQGSPYEGHTGNAGEVGFLPMTALHAGTDIAHVGVAFNLPRLYERLRAAGREAHTPADLGRLFDAGDAVLAGWLAEGAERMAWLMLSVEYLLDPQAVFFGGRLPANLLEALRAGVVAAMPDRRIEGAFTAPQYLLATAGADAAALGVATLPIYELSAPAHKVLLKRSGDGADEPAATAAPAG